MTRDLFRWRSAPPRGVALLVAAVGCVLGLAWSGCGRSSGTVPPTGSTYTLMQMNLCLSGLAGCYRKAAYHVRFSRVIYGGDRLRCVRPGGRGLFGVAVLTAAAAESADSRHFAAQAGPERRGWLCVTTRDEIDVCTAHLNTRSPVEVAGNDAQCAELAALLAGRASSRAVAFGGDVNRRRPCAPDGLWTRSDTSAGQAPGLQHVYGSDALRSPSAHVVTAAHSDHDVLVVRARLAAR